MRLIFAIVFLIVLANTAFGSELRTNAVAKPPHCKEQVTKIFAEIMSAQTGKRVQAEDVNIGQLTKYEWTIYATLQDGQYLEYLADVDMEDNCNITSMIEAESEQPKYDRHWQKQN